VRGHDAALRAGLARGGQRRLAIAGGDVQDPASRADVSELHQPLADMPGRAVGELAPVLPSHRSRIPLLVLSFAEVNRVDRLGFHARFSSPPQLQCTATLADSITV